VCARLILTGAIVLEVLERELGAGLQLHILTIDKLAASNFRTLWIVNIPIK
jgi:hypothetical protein